MLKEAQDKQIVIREIHERRIMENLSETQKVRSRTNDHVKSQTLRLFAIVPVLNLPAGLNGSWI